jgi:hypothetical protein
MQVAHTEHKCASESWILFARRCLCFSERQRRFFAFFASWNVGPFHHVLFCWNIKPLLICKPLCYNNTLTGMNRPTLARQWRTVLCFWALQLRLRYEMSRSSVMLRDTQHLKGLHPATVSMSLTSHLCLPCLNNFPCHYIRNTEIIS